MDYGLEFGLGQGWARGLRIVFGDVTESSRIDLDRTIHVEQHHGPTILPASPRDAGRIGRADGVCASGDDFKESGRVLLIKTADCMPLVFVDRERKLVAAVHAGWRGLQQGIHLNPFDRMGFVPETTWVWVGPCLNGSSFEVGPDMYRQFPEAEDPRFFPPVGASAPDKRTFNSWAYLEAQLKARRVELVYNVEVDTYTAPSFASYRRAVKAGQKLAQQNYSWVGFGEAPLK